MACWRERVTDEGASAERGRAFKFAGKRRTASRTGSSPPGVPLALILASTDLRVGLRSHFYCLAFLCVCRAQLTVQTDV